MLSRVHPSIHQVHLCALPEKAHIDLAAAVAGRKGHCFSGELQHVMWRLFSWKVGSRHFLDIFVSQLYFQRYILFSDPELSKKNHKNHKDYRRQPQSHRINGKGDGGDQAQHQHDVHHLADVSVRWGSFWGICWRFPKGMGYDGMMCSSGWLDLPLDPTRKTTESLA